MLRAILLLLAGVGRGEIAERTAAALNLVGLRKEDLECHRISSAAGSASASVSPGQS
jgi:hypothetical protein